MMQLLSRAEATAPFPASTSLLGAASGMTIWPRPYAFYSGCNDRIPTPVKGLLPKPRRRVCTLPSCVVHCMFRELVLEHERLPLTTPNRTRPDIALYTLRF